LTIYRDERLPVATAQERKVREHAGDIHARVRRKDEALQCALKPPHGAALRAASHRRHCRDRNTRAHRASSASRTPLLD